MNDNEIAEWCKDTNLPEYVCINEIKEMNKNDFIEKYGNFKAIIPSLIKKNILNIEENKNEIIKLINAKTGHKLKNCNISTPTTINMNRKNGINEAINNKKEYDYGRCKENSYTIINYNDEDYYHIVGISNEKELPKQTTDYLKKTPYFVDGNVVKYSVIKDKYKIKKDKSRDDSEDSNDSEDNQELPDKYYWKTPNGLLYLYDKNKPDIYSLEIVTPSTNITNTSTSNINTTQPILNEDLQLFINACCKPTNKTNLRFGLKEIYSVYEMWCKTHGKKQLKTQKKFKEEFEKFNYKEEESKGVDIFNNSGKRGYNIMVSI
jgi:hypothetical protein